MNIKNKIRLLSLVIFCGLGTMAYATGAGFTIAVKTSVLFTFGFEFRLTVTSIDVV